MTTTPTYLKTIFAASLLSVAVASWSFLSYDCLARSPTKTAKPMPPADYYLYVVSTTQNISSHRNGMVVSHRVKEGKVYPAAHESGSIYEPRFVQTSQDRKYLFVGGVFERENPSGGAALLRAQPDGSLTLKGWWLTYDVAFSLWQVPNENPVYVSTYGELLTFRAGSITELQKNGVTVRTPRKPGTEEPKTALYRKDRAGKLVRETRFVKDSRIPDFEDAAGGAGPNLLYHQGRTYPLTDTAYLADDDTATVTVAHFDGSPTKLSVRQRVALPKLSPGEPDGKFTHKAVIVREPRGRYVYVFTMRSGFGKIYQLAVAQTGLLTLRREQIVEMPTTEWIKGMVFSPGGDYLHVLGSRIYTYRVRPNGAIDATRYTWVDTVEGGSEIAAMRPAR